MKTLNIILLVLLAVPLWAGKKEYDEAVNLIKQSKYGVAKVLLEATLKTDDRPRVRFALGFCYEKTGEKDKALAHYRVAVLQNMKTAQDADDAGRALKRLVAAKPDLGPVLEKAMELDAEAIKRKSPFLKEAAASLRRYALNPANWKEPEKPEPVATVKPKRPSKRPPSAVKFNGHYYKFYSLKGLKTSSVAASRSLCMRLGGYLATVTSKEEFDFLVRLTNPTPEQGVWLGGLIDKTKKVEWYTRERDTLEGVDRFYSDGIGGHVALAHNRKEVILMGMRESGKNSKNVAMVKGYVCEWEE